MKITQREMNNAYVALENIALGNVPVADIIKIKRARKEMRPHVEAYRAFDEDVRKSLPNYDVLAELERKGKDCTEEEVAKYKELIPAFKEALDAALTPELEKEYDLPIEQISEEGEAQIVSNNNLSQAALKVIQCVIG